MILVKVWCLPFTIASQQEKMREWITRAIVEAQHGEKKDIVCLFPSDTTSQHDLDPTTIVEVSSAPNPELLECIGKAVDGFYHDMGPIKMFHHPVETRSF